MVLGRRAVPLLTALPLHPLRLDGGIPGPTWENAPVPDGVDAEMLAELVEGTVRDQPAEQGMTLALLVAHHGRIVAEAYGPDADATSTLISWSMAKSILHALVGLLVLDGRLDPAQSTGLWSDERAEITFDHLLAMRSGLRWNEDYVDGSASDVIEMLFGSGAADMGAYAAVLPLEHRPGQVWNYSSGSSNIVASACREILGGEDATRQFLQERLFDPLGVATATPRFDEAGTFVASSYVDATTRDFARFGLLYLRDGTWDGRRLLPEGWVDRARTPQAFDPVRNEGYGEHWWTTDDPLGTFSASGYEGQRIMCVPAADLVIVRLGKTPADLGFAWRDHLHRIVRLFAPDPSAHLPFR